MKPRACIIPGCPNQTRKYAARCPEHSAHGGPVASGIYWPTAAAWELDTSEPEAGKDAV